MRVIESSFTSYALGLDRIISEGIRHIISRVIFLLLLVTGAATLAFEILRYIQLEASAPVARDITQVLEELPVGVVSGIFYILLAIFFVGFFLEFFYRSNLRPSPVFEDAGLYDASVEVERALLPIRLRDGAPFMFQRFFEVLGSSSFMDILLVRLGIPQEDFERAMKLARKTPQMDVGEIGEAIRASLDKEGRREIRMKDLLGALLSFDEIWKQFCFDHKIVIEDITGAAEWVESELDSGRKSRVWWSRDVLRRIPGIGKNFGFGYTYALDRFSRNLEFVRTRFVHEARKAEIEAVETVLSRSYQANVLIVGEDGSGKHSVLEGLATWIRDGRAVPALEHKRVVLLDTASIVASAKTKGIFEESLIKILDDAAHAGNIILVFENFPNFLLSSSELGTDALEIIEPYLEGRVIQVVGLASRGLFEREIEPNGRVMKLFEKVDLEEPEGERLMGMLEDALTGIENNSGKMFTYPALRRAHELAGRFVTEGAMPEKAIDVLVEAASASTGPVVWPNDIDQVVEKKTKIPTREAEESEREKLLNLESLLHERMVGQEAAISKISDALRRARSGLKSKSRPMGSFLFLGPTGVGKTETARALAELYFGGEDSMMRFDMSEYRGEDSVRKLIGSYDTTTPGILTSKLREHPYSLLLFDEFEKASRDVHNIFLQILDEGVFQDGSGRKVSARETMIIATSNAGANLIWDLIKAGKDPATIDGDVIDEIRKTNIFAPELLNRFDAIVVYHPLSEGELEKISLLMLKGLARELKVKEITFEPTAELAKRIVEIAFDPSFGARPMRRAIADKVEQIIAKKLLSGNLKRGDTLTFTQEEIAKL